MNAARKRRPLIRKKARWATIRRLSREKVRRRGEDVVMPPERELMMQGRIYLDYANTIEYHALTSVWIEIPARGFMRKLNEMQEKGFWAPRPQSQQLFFVPPGKIIQASMRPMED